MGESMGFIEETKEEIKQRLKSSYAGSYALVWCAFNYEFLIVVFSGGEYSDKIGYIARHLYFERSPLFTFGWPALLALIPVLALPLLNQGAELWAKVVEALGNYLSRCIETKKLRTDPELRELARNRSFEVDTMRAHAREALMMHSVLVASSAVFAQPTKARLVMLPDAFKKESSALTQVAENVGFPWSGYHMLKTLQSEETRTEDQMIAIGASDEGREEKKWTLALLLGFKLVRLKWEHGTMPSYELATAGKDFLRLVSQHYPEAFGYPG